MPRAQEAQQRLADLATSSYGQQLHSFPNQSPYRSGYGGYGAINSNNNNKQRRAHTNSFGSSSAKTNTVKKLTNWQTCYHLLSFLAGSGMLCLPLALVEIDWYGVLLLIVAASISVYTTKLLVECLDVVRWSRGTNVEYSDLGYECFGRVGKVFTQVMVHSCFLITSTGYLSLASSCIAGVTGLKIGTVLVIVVIGVWFQVFINSLTQLAIVSALNVGLTFWIESIIFGDAMYPLKQIALEDSAFVFTRPDLSESSMFVKLCYSFSLLASGFFCHSIIPTMYNAMENHRMCTSVVGKSQFAAMTMLYLPICSITYAVYGDTLEAPVFFNMRNALVRNMAIILFSIHLLFSYTIAIYPLQRAFESCLLGAPSGGTLPRVQSFSLGRGLSSSSAHHVEATVKVFCRTTVILVTLFWSYVLMPNTLNIFGYMLVPSTMISLILPPVFYWKICDEEAGCLDKLANILVLIIAVVTMVCSLTIVV